jgi:hypothetical protein
LSAAFTVRKILSVGRDSLSQFGGPELDQGAHRRAAIIVDYPVRPEFGKAQDWIFKEEEKK